jgi:hypothetical protein
MDTGVLKVSCVCSTPGLQHDDPKRLTRPKKRIKRLGLPRGAMLLD